MKINANKKLLSVYSKQNFRSFVICLSRLLSNQKFDAILCAGNSGMAMGAFTQMVYEIMGLPTPPIIPVAIYREGNLLGNKQDIKIYTPAQQDLKPYLPKNFITSNILVVDDEISTGRVVETAMRLLERTAKRKFKFTLLAEDRGYNSLTKSNDLKISFIPFSRKRPLYYIVIFYVMPVSIQNKLHSVVSKMSNEKYAIKYVTSLLLDLPTRELVKGHRKFVHKYDNAVRKAIPNFTTLQIQYRRRLKKLITEALQKDSSNL